MATLPSAPANPGGIAAGGRALSPTNRSSRPMATGSIFFASTHCASHWDSCGHTRPHTDGNRLDSWTTPSAPSTSRTNRWRMNRGMSMATGQPATHSGLAHWMHRSASWYASSSA